MTNDNAIAFLVRLIALLSALAAGIILVALFRSGWAEAAKLLGVFLLCAAAGAAPGLLTLAARPGRPAVSRRGGSNSPHPPRRTP